MIVGAVITVRVQLLPDVIDLSFVPTGAGGVGGLLAAAFGAGRRWPPDRLGRVVLLGNLFGGAATLGVLVLALVVGVP